MIGLKKNRCVRFPLFFFLGASIILAIILANWRFYPGIILPATAEAPSSWPTPFNHPAALSRFAVFFVRVVILVSSWLLQSQLLFRQMFPYVFCRIRRVESTLIRTTGRSQ